MDWNSPTTKKHIAEAKAQGCELLGAGKDYRHRTYRLPCGHEQEVETGKVRSVSFRCQTCMKNKLVAEAEAQGCELLGAGKNYNYRTYQLPCGHKQEMTISSMRRGTVRCRVCTNNNWIEEANSQGCMLLGAGKNFNYRTYKLPCGHETEVQVTHMRMGNFRCPTCLNNRLIVSAT